MSKVLQRFVYAVGQVSLPHLNHELHGAIGFARILLGQLGRGKIYER